MALPLSPRPPRARLHPSTAGGLLRRSRHGAALTGRVLATLLVLGVVGTVIGLVTGVVLTRVVSLLLGTV